MSSAWHCFVLVAWSHGRRPRKLHQYERSKAFTRDLDIFVGALHITGNTASRKRQPRRAQWIQMTVRARGLLWGANRHTGILRSPLMTLAVVCRVIITKHDTFTAHK